MTTSNPITEQELTNLKHSLNLLLKQVNSGRIEQDYATRQIEKLQEFLGRVGNQDLQTNSEGSFEVLYNVNRAIGSSLDLQTVLDHVMDGVIQLTGAERGFLMLSDDDGNLKVKVARNLDQQTLSSSEFEYSRTISNHVLNTGEAVLTTNAVEDPRFKEKASIVTQSLRSILAAPLRARGRIIGIAYVENRVVAGMFKSSDLTMFETLIGQASIAIDNALLFEETDDKLHRRVEELSELRRIDMQLNVKLDPDAAMQFTLETACRLSEATEGHLGLIQQKPRRIMATHHFSPKASTATRELPIHLGNAYPKAWDVINTKTSVVYDTGQYGLLTVMIVPIIRDNESVGVMVLLREDGSSFSDEQKELIERVVVRAAITIENARLYAAVQAADKAKSDFVGIVAHDLKAPMTSIRGYADLMLYQGDNLEERQKRYLNRISATVDRMEILVSDLADISRIESGQFLMNPAVVDIENVIESVNDTVIPQMQERAHNYQQQIPDDVPDLWVDYYRLVQVLVNLLSNAYKYTPDGGTITLAIALIDDRVRFSVQDTGIGLSKENITMLGTKFWRAEDEYTRSQPGTGLGFSITRALVEQMGSHLEIESEIDVGSTFIFSVPIATDAQKAQRFDE